MPDKLIKWLGESITGETLKYAITAVVLYKIFTPVRYIATLAVTNVIIKLFKRQGKIPLQPPPGSSIKDLYKEQQLVIRRNLKRQREKYNTRVGRFRRFLPKTNQFSKSGSSIFGDANRRKNI